MKIKSYFFKKESNQSINFLVKLHYKPISNEDQQTKTKPSDEEQS